MQFRSIKMISLILFISMLFAFGSCTFTDDNGETTGVLESPHIKVSSSTSPVQSESPAVPDDKPEANEAGIAGPVPSETVSDYPEGETSKEAISPAQNENERLSGLENEIDNLILSDGTECIWDVWVEILPEGESIHCASTDAQSPMVAASLIKLFIMAAVYEKVLSGDIDEAEVSINMKNMITVSDNNAANDLTTLLGSGSAEAGMEAVNAYAEKIGCNDTKMNRLMLAENGLQNYTTAKDCAFLLKMIYSGKCVSVEYSETMLGLLENQERTGKIPAGIPNGIVTANKTGELIGLSECDVAIVFGESADYIICVLSEPKNNQSAIDRIIEISEISYSYINDCV